LDAAPRADVQRPVDTRTRRQGIENASRRRVGRDVVGRVVAVAGEAVRGEEDFADRQDPCTRSDPVADLREPCRLQRLDALSAECGLGVLHRNRQLEKEQPDQRRERCVWQATFLGGRVGALARVRVFTEQSVDCVLRIAGTTQSRAEPLGRGGVGHEIFVHHQSGIIMPESNGPQARFEVD